MELTAEAAAANRESTLCFAQEKNRLCNCFEEGYRQLLKKYGAIHRGKFLKIFESLYDELYLAGSYRGNLRSVGVVKATLKTAQEFIDKLGS